MKFFKFLTIFFFPLITVGQSTIDTVSLAHLPPVKYDYKKCVVRIKAGEWTLENDKNILPVFLTIDNFSGDTLKYELKNINEKIWGDPNRKLERYDPSPPIDILHKIFKLSIILPHQKEQWKFYYREGSNQPHFHGKIRISIYITIARGNEFFTDEAFDSIHGTFLQFPGKDVKNRSHWLRSNTIKL